MSLPQTVRPASGAKAVSNGDATVQSYHVAGSIEPGMVAARQRHNFPNFLGKLCKTLGCAPEAAIISAYSATCRGSQASNSSDVIGRSRAASSLMVLSNPARAYSRLRRCR